jgi:hypothetical protein
MAVACLSLKFGFTFLSAEKTTGTAKFDGRQWTVQQGSLQLSVWNRIK